MSLWCSESKAESCLIFHFLFSLPGAYVWLNFRYMVWKHRSTLLLIKLKRVCWHSRHRGFDSLRANKNLSVHFFFLEISSAHLVWLILFSFCTGYLPPACSSHSPASSCWFFVVAFCESLLSSLSTILCVYPTSCDVVYKKWSIFNCPSSLWWWKSQNVLLHKCAVLPGWRHFAPFSCIHF